MAFVLAAVLSSGVSHAQAGAPRGAENLRVLFIGNSLTAANDLPAMVAGLAAAGGQRPLVWKAVLRLPGRLADGGTALVDVPAAETRLLQESAAEANRRFGIR